VAKGLAAYNFCNNLNPLTRLFQENMQDFAGQEVSTEKSRVRRPEGIKNPD
jgi:hypothetical protein